MKINTEIWKTTPPNEMYEKLIDTIKLNLFIIIGITTITTLQQPNILTITATTIATIADLIIWLSYRKHRQNEANK